MIASFAAARAIFQYSTYESSYDRFHKDEDFQMPVPILLAIVYCFFHGILNPFSKLHNDKPVRNLLGIFCLPHNNGQ